MKLLDLFCGAGGAAMGYYRAGFEVTGVDNRPQSRYPFEFIHADALEYLTIHGHKYDYIHASPPCQAHSMMTKGRWQDKISNHPQLIEPTRELLLILGKPFDIENVPGAPLINPIMLCGTMFNLTTKHGSQLRRHRYFETNWQVGLVPPCNHNKSPAIGVYGGGQHPNRRKVPSTIGVYGQTGGLSNRDNLLQFGIQDRRDAMDIQWMSGKELSQAIPPAYTEYIGSQFLRILL